MMILAAIISAVMVVPWIITGVMIFAFGIILPVISIALVTFRLNQDDVSFAGVSPNRKGLLRILVVDDDLGSVLPLIAMLESPERQVTFVSSGREMIEKLSSEIFDLVFLDNSMPLMTGSEALVEAERILCNSIRQPVIFFSNCTESIKIPSEMRHFDVREFWPKDGLELLQNNVNRLSQEYVSAVG